MVLVGVVVSRLVYSSRMSSSIFMVLFLGCIVVVLVLVVCWMLLFWVGLVFLFGMGYGWW